MSAEAFRAETATRSAGLRAMLEAAEAADAARRIPIAERLADEVPLAVGAVLTRAHDRTRPLLEVLELEADDPRVAELYHQARKLQKAIAIALVQLTIDATEVAA